MTLTLTESKSRRIAAAILLTLSFAMITTSCAALPTWITEAQQILPVAVSIISGLLGIVTALENKTISAVVLNGITAVETKVQGGLAELETLIKAYNAAPGASVLAQIEAGVTDVISNLTSLFSVAGISDAATQAKITAIAQLVISELQAWSSILPIIQAAPGTKHTLTVPFTAKQFKAAYDTVLTTPTGQPDVDAACAAVHKL